MKKVISAILACVFVCALAFSAFAAVSPEAPTIDETTTKDSTDIDPTIDETTTKDDTTRPTTPPTTPPTTDKGDVDETTTDKADVETTTKNDVTSDKGPVSPDTGSHVGKTVTAAAVVAVVLGGAVVYTTKKKAE